MNVVIPHFVALIACGFILSNFPSFAKRIGESTVTTLSLIADYGYPSEKHKVTTSDNYILTLYRIPYSPKNATVPATGKRPVIFIMHGLGQSSCDWVLSGYPRGLAFYLSDAGYDVWLGNARGMRFSKEHKNLDVSDSKYWDFSWHEIGIYDLPANIDYVLKNTSSTKLQYIGHSQGGTSFLVATSSLPEFNEKISSAFLLAPAAFVAHTTSPLVTMGATVLGYPRSIFEENFEFLPNNIIFQIASELICGNYFLRGICLSLSNLIFGPDSTYTNSTALEIYFETAPAGFSYKQLIHYLQLINSKKFRAFDYGFLENMFIYKQSTPPKYEIGKITTPIYIYHSENDALAAPKDIKKLSDGLQPSTLKKVYKMPFESWNHLDFVLGNDVDKVLYSIILEDIKKGA